MFTFHRISIIGMRLEVAVYEIEGAVLMTIAAAKAALIDDHPGTPLLAFITCLIIKYCVNFVVVTLG